MIEVIEHNLTKGEHLLKSISKEQYNNINVAPYYSSIGTHIRHVMDMFHCIFDGIESGNIDLAARRRNKAVEEQLDLGLEYIAATIDQLQAINSDMLGETFRVTDDLGGGKVTIEYTLAAILSQAHSHAIHHYASIGYIIHQLGIQLPDNGFGFNPTTPKKEMVKS